jgi:histone acetyltransferase 1
MLALLRLDPRDPRALKAFRLQVKERLYRFNFVSVSAAHLVGSLL